MVEMPKDPLEPPKFKHKRIPRVSGSPPPPVMHSPPRKITMKDQQEWKIPPCVSNWKNNKGYTVPIDMRLAADGRGLQEFTVNDNFAKLTEALLIAERNAREEVEKRNQLHKKYQIIEKQKKEETLRKLAAEAREQREEITQIASESIKKELSRDEINALKKRDDIREDRRRDRERDRRLESAGNRKKSKISRDEDRDVSEKIALGIKAPTQTAETQFDQRLFNQTQGMDSGFADDEAYNVFDKPLFSGHSTNFMYKHKKGEDKNDMYGDEDKESATDKDRKTGGFRPDKGFAGTETDQPRQPRNRPVEFEKGDERLEVLIPSKETHKEKDPAKEEDPYGFESLFADAKATKKKPLDKIGQRGTLHAGASGSHSDDKKSSSRRDISFEKEKSSSSRSHRGKRKDSD